MTVRKQKKIIQPPSPSMFEVRASDIHGYGCFATRHINEGERVVEYIGEKITKAVARQRGIEHEEQARKTGGGMVYIFELNKRYDIDGSSPDNVARYINHSCEPNCEAVNIRGRIWYVALRDIEEGDEISIDYGYDLSHFLDHPCRCGAPSCVGYIVRTDQRARLRRMLAKRNKKTTTTRKRTSARKKNL